MILLLKTDIYFLEKNRKGLPAIMTLNRINISSGAPWEAKASYSRAVKIGNHIFVSGTTATDLNGEITGDGNYYLQSSKCIENIKSAL